MSSVPRPALRRAAVAALAMLAIGTALGACTSTVAGRGALEVSARGPVDPPDPSSTSEPTDEPTSGPTDEPTDQPTDQPTEEPTEEPTSEPTGSGDDQQAVAAAAEDFYHSLGAKDGERTCALMTESAQRETAGSSADCPTAVSQVSLTPEQSAALARIQIDADRVQVQGDQASVPASAASVDGQASTASGEMELVRDGGNWKINDITS